MEIICFSGNVRQWNLTFSVGHVQVCFKSFLFIIKHFLGWENVVLKNLSRFRPTSWRVGKVAQNKSVCMEIRRQIMLLRESIELNAKILGMQPQTKASSHNLNFSIHFSVVCFTGTTKIKTQTTEKCLEKFKLRSVPGLPSPQLHVEACYLSGKNKLFSFY